MSDDFDRQVLLTLGRQARSDRQHGGDIPALYMPWVQRVLNPVPLASSGTTFMDSVVPSAVRVLKWYCDVYVNTTNNGTNFWTLTLSSFPSATTIATFNTSAIAANTGVRFATSPGAQPSSTDIFLYISGTATLSPGSIFVMPAVAILRNG